MSRRPSLKIIRQGAELTLADNGYARFRVGDLARITETAELLFVRRVWGGGRRYWEPVPLWRSVWDWLRRRGWHRTKTLEWYPGGMRVHRRRTPSPLPRRLP